MIEFEVCARLGLALALGLLIGLERGWQGREAAAHSRVAVDISPCGSPARPEGP